MKYTVDLGILKMRANFEMFLIFWYDFMIKSLASVLSSFRFLAILTKCELVHHDLMDNHDYYVCITIGNLAS